jgi:hypothetical protein
LSACRTIVEVDEQLGTQDRVELRLARRVAARQALERRRLVRAEVIDVHVGMCPERREDQIDDELERLLLFLSRRGPGREVDQGRRRGAWAALRVVGDQQAEQVFAAAVRREPVALEVEKDVVARRPRQQRETVLGPERPQDLVLR